jgi:hypothetical protein
VRLKEAGFVEGETVTIEYRFADNQLDRLPALAAELVRRRVAVIVAFGSPAASAARSFGPARPRAIGCDGAGGCVIASQVRQENFSRTCWITFH